MYAHHNRTMGDRERLSGHWESALRSCLYRLFATTWRMQHTHRRNFNIKTRPSASICQDSTRLEHTVPCCAIQQEGL